MPETNHTTALSDMDNEREKAAQRRAIFEDEETYDDLDDSIYENQEHIPVTRDPVTHQPKPPNFDPPPTTTKTVVFKDDDPPVQSAPSETKSFTFVNDDPLPKQPLSPLMKILVCTIVAFILAAMVFIIFAIVRSAPRTPTAEQQDVVNHIAFDSEVLNQEQASAEMLKIIVKDYITGQTTAVDALADVEKITVPTDEDLIVNQLCAITARELEAFAAALNQNIRYQQKITWDSEDEMPDIIKDAVYISFSDILTKYNEYAGERETGYGLWLKDVKSRANNCGLMAVDENKTISIRAKH